MSLDPTSSSTFMAMDSRRLVVFVMSVMVGLGSGSNYVRFTSQFLCFLPDADGCNRCTLVRVEIDHDVKVGSTDPPVLAYAPQLASQLVLSSTQVNLVGVAGNLGMYLTSPL